MYDISTIWILPSLFCILDLFLCIFWAGGLLLCEFCTHDKIYPANIWSTTYLYCWMDRMLERVWYAIYYRNKGTYLLLGFGPLPLSQSWSSRYTLCKSVSMHSILILLLSYLSSIHASSLALPHPDRSMSSYSTNACVMTRYVKLAYLTSPSWRVLPL